MRNWHQSDIFLLKYPGYIITGCTLPMRNWHIVGPVIISSYHACSLFVVPYLWGIDTQFLLATYRLYMLHKLYLTYEELTLTPNAQSVAVMATVVPYLWGIDTKFFPGLMNSYECNFSKIVVPYLWGIDTFSVCMPHHLLLTGCTLPMRN